MDPTQHIRLVLVGRPGSELRLAARLARDAGADVAMADDVAGALTLLRSTGAGLVMIEVGLDIAGLIAAMHRERFATPVLACGVDAPADQAVAAIRAGARDYVPLPPQRELIAAALATAAAVPTTDFVGEDAALTRVVGFGMAMAGAHVPVLIAGEKGTGKELLARKIHAASGFTGPFELIECAGVKEMILDSELFGHEAGAFDGAVARRVGRLERAGRGTILLRDVDCLPAATQAKLAATLQSSAIRRLGGTEVVPLTARLIATTTADLAERVADGEFRADLAARFDMVRLTLPPLRARGADLRLLASCFTERLAGANGRAGLGIDEDALALLASHDWPGNVRELHDTIHRAVLLARGERIGTDDLVLTDGRRLVAQPAEPESAALEVRSLVGRTVEEVERELILQTLERCHGNRTSASGILGISVRTMRNKLKTFIEAGIPVAPAA